jgi:hypothetical protein
MDPVTSLRSDQFLENRTYRDLATGGIGAVSNQTIAIFRYNYNEFLLTDALSHRGSAALSAPDAILSSRDPMAIFPVPNPV